MLATIKCPDSGKTVVVAKMLTGYITEKKKIADADNYVKINGAFDNGFAAYVLAWQERHGCIATGDILPATWTAIAKNAPTCSTLRNKKSGHTFALQLLLGGNLKPDAIYGKNTKAAVVAFQKAHGLSADGVCGPKTWNALIAGVEEPQKPTQKSEGTTVKKENIEWGTEPATPTSDPCVVITHSKVNVYDAAGGKNAIGYVKKGEKYTYDLVADVGNRDWYRIDYMDLYGWIDGKYAKIA